MVLLVLGPSSENALNSHFLYPLLLKLFFSAPLTLFSSFPASATKNSKIKNIARKVKDDAGKQPTTEETS